MSSSLQPQAQAQAQEAEESLHPVKLFVYDLSNGMARALSPQLLGIPIEGVWHTSVVVHNTEVFYSAGIQKTKPLHTHYGQPLNVVDMGKTAIPIEIIQEYLADVAAETYTAEKYNLFHHNCNHFSADMCDFLVGKSIPAYIKDLPETVLRTPFGQMLKPMVEQMMAPITQVGEAPQSTQL